MAQIREVKILDDLNGEAGAKGHEFAIDGKTYEIDLADANMTKLMEILTPFINAGRRVGPGRKQAYARPGTAGNSGGSYPGKRTLSREESAAIRTWAHANGHQVSDRGRISNDVLKAYENRDTSKPVPPRDVPYTEARGWCVREGINVVGKQRAWVAERYMDANPGTVVEIGDKVKAS